MSPRVEKEKSRFAGNELKGKTLGIVGLGAIGSMVAEMALAMGMKVVGFDPVLSIDAAWRLSNEEMCIRDSGTTVDSADLRALMPWLAWAYAQVAA